MALFQFFGGQARPSKTEIASPLRSDTPTQLNSVQAFRMVAKNPSSRELGPGILSEGGFMLGAFAFEELLAG